MFSTLSVAGAASLPLADQPGLIPSGAPPPAESISLSEAGAKRARALALYFEGLALARRRQPARAIDRFLDVLKLDPSNLGLAKRLADTYIIARKLDDALAILEHSLRENPQRPEAFINLSEFCARHHNNSDSIKSRAFAVAREAVEKFPQHSVVYGNLVGLLLLESERDQAAEVIERAAARSETDPHFWLDLGGYAAQVWPLMEPANHEKITVFFKKALDLAPDHPEVMEAVADHHAQTRRFGDAVPLYERAIRHRPDDLRAREKLAHALSLSGRQEEALQVWQKLLEINPSSESVHQALAKFHAAQGERNKAIEHRAAALRFSEDPDLNSSLRLVREMLTADMPRQALEVLERAEFNHPSSPEPPYHSALAHARLGEHEKGLAAFERAAQAAGGDPAAATALLSEGFYFEWGMAFSRAGQIDNAAEKFRKSIELTPKDHPELAAKSFNALGYLWLEHDRNIDEAGQLIERALKLESGNAAYLDSLGWFHFKKNEHARALEWLRQAEAASPEPDAENLDHVAQVLRALGQNKDALETLDKAVALPQATPAMRERLKAWRENP
ncbi:MAG: tetratricopeptide repeat protein [Verrucomicrobiales bacterium]